MPNAESTWDKLYDYAPCYVESQLNTTFTCPAALTPWNDPLCSGNNGYNPWNSAGCCDCKYINYKYPAPHAYSNGVFTFVYGWVCLGTFCAILVAYLLMLLASMALRVLPGCRISSFNMSGRRMWTAGVWVGTAAILGQFIAFSIWYVYVSMIGFNVLGYVAPWFALGASRVGVMMHALAGASWMLGVCVQFTPFVRRRWPVLHRAVGMFTLASLLVAAAGLFLLVSGPHVSGFGGFFAGWTFGLYWIFCAVMGVINIKAKRVQEHRIWMIRTVYLGFGIICERAPQGLIAKYLPLSTFLGADFATLLAAPQYATIAKGVVILYKQWYLGATFWWCEAWAVFFGEAYLYLAFDAGLFTTILGPRRGGHLAAPLYILPTPVAAAIDDDPPALPPIRSTGWKQALLGTEEAHAEVVLPTRGRGLRQVLQYLDHNTPLTFTARRAAGRHAQLLYLSLPHPYMSFSAAPGHDLAVTAYVKGSKPTIRTYSPILLPPEIAELDPLMTPSTVLLLVKKVESGVMSEHLLDMASGEKLLAEGGLGRFSFTPGAYARIGILAGGSGISGVLSVMTAALCDPWDTSRIDLVYANYYQEDILMKPQLDAMAKLFNDRLTITYVVTSGNPPSGKHYDQGGDFLLAPRISTVPRARVSVPPPASLHHAPAAAAPPPPAVAVVASPPKPAVPPAQSTTNDYPPPPVTDAGAPLHTVDHDGPLPVDSARLKGEEVGVATPRFEDAAPPRHLPDGVANEPASPVQEAGSGMSPSRDRAPIVVAPPPKGVMSSMAATVTGAVATVTKPVSAKAAAKVAAAGLPQPQVERRQALEPPAPLAPLPRGQLPPGPLRMAMAPSAPPPAPLPPPMAPEASSMASRPTELGATAATSPSRLVSFRNALYAPEPGTHDATLDDDLVELPAPPPPAQRDDLSSIVTGMIHSVVTGATYTNGGAAPAAPVIVAAAESPADNGAASSLATATMGDSLAVPLVVVPLAQPAELPASSEEPVPPPVPLAVPPPAAAATPPAAAAPVREYMPVPALAFYHQPPRTTMSPPVSARAKNADGMVGDSGKTAGGVKQAHSSVTAAPPPASSKPSVEWAAAPPPHTAPPPPAPAAKPRAAWLSQPSSTKIVYGPLTPELLSGTPLVKDQAPPGGMQLLICGPPGFNLAMMHTMGKLGQPSAHTWAFGTSDR